MGWILPEWLVAFALTLFVVDIFVSTEFLSWCGVMSLSMWLTWRVHVNWKWDALVFIGSFVLFAFAYYWGVRASIGRLVKNWMQKGAPMEVSGRIIGAVGVVHYVEGRPFFKWNGEELLPIMEDVRTTFQESEIVSVVRLVDGCAVLRRQEHGQESNAS